MRLSPGSRNVSFVIDPPPVNLCALLSLVRSLSSGLCHAGRPCAVGAIIRSGRGSPCAEREGEVGGPSPLYRRLLLMYRSPDLPLSFTRRLFPPEDASSLRGRVLPLSHAIHAVSAFVCFLLVCGRLFLQGHVVIYLSSRVVLFFRIAGFIPPLPVLPARRPLCGGLLWDRRGTSAH